MVISLVDMNPGEKGVVVDIQGGMGATGRIQGLGIRVGKNIEKTASQFGRGPQSVIVDNFKAAIGYGMASKIIVEVER